MANRSKLVALVVVTVLVAAVAAWIVLPGRASDAAARAAAQRYVDAIASGDEDDLEELWAMTVAESPGAMRTAGEVLAGAEERIEVVSVGEPKSVETRRVVYPVQLEDFVEVEVRYRLAGEDHEWPVVLGKLLGESGSDLGDWRVTTPMAGTIAWEQLGSGDFAMDVYVSSVRQVRRPVLGTDEDVQPLYPAVYRTQGRLDPYYDSDEETVAVTAGEEVAPPRLAAEPTPKTQALIRRAVWRSFESCGRIPTVYPVCPAEDLVQSLGVDIYDTDWWRGLTRRPAVTFDGASGISLSGGEFRFRGPGGVVRELRFTGSGSYVVSFQSSTPQLSELVATEAR